MKLKILRLRNDTTCGYEVYTCTTYKEARQLYHGLKQNNRTMSVHILTDVTDDVLGYVVKPLSYKEKVNDSRRV
jgi:hypothetical protein